MKIGLFGIGSGVSANPEVAAKLAKDAESAGFDSVWTGEHVVLPDPRMPPSPAEPNHPMLHPSTVLSYVAAVTKSLLLGTGITLIAQRNPLVLAKEMSSLDFLSNGRLIFGIGAGYLIQEFDALGVTFSERGARTDEFLEILKVMWLEENPSFEGKFYQFRNIQAQPRPKQQGGPPIVVGGTSNAALRRAVRQRAGWYGFALDVEQTKSVLHRLYDLGGEGLEISVTPPGRLDRQVVEDYQSIGVQRLIGLTPQSSEDSLFRAVDAMARLIPA